MCVQARLYHLQCRPSIRAGLREAQLLQPAPASAQPPLRADQQQQQLEDFEEENPRILPRLTVFPEAEPSLLKESEDNSMLW